jgi:small-conductance mechanosensitive channel
MINFSPTEVILGFLTLGLSVYVLITKSAFFKGRQSVRQEIDDKNSEVIPILQTDVNSLLKDVKYVIESHKQLSSRVSIMEKAAVLQDVKLVQLEKFFERILTQNNELQKNLIENSKAINSLGSSMESVRELLDNLIKGNLIIRKDG